MSTTTFGQSSQSKVKQEREAEAAWAELKVAQRPMLPPDEWRTRAITREDDEQFRRARRDHALKLGELASGFYSRFPDHPASEEARTIKFTALQSAAGLSVSLGEDDQQGATSKLESLLSNPNLPEAERFNLKWELVIRKSFDKLKSGNQAVAQELEKRSKALQEEFPNRPGIDQLLLHAARTGDSLTAARIGADIINGPGSEKVKREAQGLVAMTAAKVRPAEMELNTIEGRKIKLQSLKGKVVLLHFWDTRMVKASGSFALIKQAYEKYHQSGLEVIGINFDPTAALINEHIERETIPWPQVFEGFRSEGPPWRKYGIDSLPTIWLIDQRGVLREQNAGTDLLEKVKVLLAK